MTSVVTAHMNTCGKTNKVTATLLDDGTIDIKIASDCPHVKDYAKNLTNVTMDDVVSFEGSKVNDPAIRASLSVPCLTPIAVFNAAWLELGMLSKKLVANVGSNTVTFDGSE